MKSRTRTLISGMTISGMILLTAMAISVQVSAQGQQKVTASTPSSHIVTFNAPHAGAGSNQGTFPVQNNAGGAITGYSIDVKNVYHGFLRAANGTLTSFDPRGAGKGSTQGTQPRGINDDGAITGFYQDANNVYHGFLRSAGGVFTTFDAPGAGAYGGQGTFGENISDAGTISGVYEDWNYVYHGFVRGTDGTFTTFDAPGAGIGLFQGTKIIYTGMTADGTITGYSIDDFGMHGYVRSPDGSMFPLVDIYGALATFGQSITTNETIAGYSQDQSNVFHGFLRTWQGTITEFDDPLAGTAPFQGTLVAGINPAQTVAGAYVDGSYVYHGFVLSAGGVFTTFDAHGSTAMYPQSINPAGAVPGYYFDQNNAAHGFLYTP